MNVALVGKSDPVDGVVVYSRQLEHRLRQGGHRTRTFHFSDRQGPHEGDPGRLPHLLRSQGYTLAAPGAVCLLEASLRSMSVDLVHAQLPVSPVDFLLPRLARRLGCR